MTSQSTVRQMDAADGRLQQLPGSQGAAQTAQSPESAETAPLGAAAFPGAGGVGVERRHLSKGSSC